MSVVTEETDVARAQQRDAIAASGWGAGFTLRQPRNFSLWVMVVLLVSGVFATWKQCQLAIDVFAESFSQGVAIFAVYALVFVYILTRLDRYSSIPGSMKMLVFVFGGTASTFAMSGPLNDAFRSILAKTAGTDVMLDWGAGIIAPISEETTKVIPLILMVAIAPQVVRCAFDGFILGAFGGLGFMIFESVSYVYSSTGAAFGQAEVGLKTAAIRVASGFFGHWMWSAIVGAGVIYLLGRPDEPARRGLGIVSIVVPMLLHGSWDAPAALTGGSNLAAALWLLLAIIGTSLFVWTYRHTVATERAWAAAILGPEVDGGTISWDELAAAIGPRKQRRHYVESKQSRAERKATEYVLEGCRDLADELARANGTDSPGVVDARAEIARVRA